jgi:ceramide glucosyltransferase
MLDVDAASRVREATAVPERPLMDEAPESPSAQPFIAPSKPRTEVAGFARYWPALAVIVAVTAALAVSNAAIGSGPFRWLGLAAAAASCFGCSVAVLGAASVWRFKRREPRFPTRWPAVSVLRPLCGDEPALDAALRSLGEQSYPNFQIVFGVQDADDPALRAVERLRAAHPTLDIAVVSNSTTHGPNRKVSNLINMLPAARHDVLVFSDSDLHVAPDYLRHLVATLAEPSTGLVTTLCTGLATTPGPAGRLGAMQITHSFLPGALLSRVLGRQDCLGTTMALRRSTLVAAGGLHGLVGHLADDNLLGRRVRQLGLRIGLADTVPATGVPEMSLHKLWLHELRWARTIRALAPAPFAASALQFPIAWALLTCLCLAGASPSLILLASAWGVRVAASCVVGGSLATRPRSLGGALATALLLPMRDVLSVAEIVASFAGREVLWRGHLMHVDVGRTAPIRLAVPDRLAPIVLEVGS